MYGYFVKYCMFKCVVLYSIFAPVVVLIYNVGTSHITYYCIQINLIYVMILIGLVTFWHSDKWQISLFKTKE